MYIQEIILDGFKSYATQTRIGPFDPSFTAITGLNGTGKSNVLDAICFVLGISSLSRIRVTSLTELIYKQGQAGVTKASATLVLNNEDPKQSPPGYESYHILEISRQIFKNGTTKYLLNGAVSKLKVIKHLFRSAGLNVDNPTFLVLQGRITTILSMKPMELLGLVEECAGTTIYDTNRSEAVKIFSAKESKLQEVSDTLTLDIFPRLQKLDAERQAAVELGRLENAMKIMGLLTDAHRLHAITIQFLSVCQKKQTQQTRIQEMVQESKAVEEHARELVEAIRSLDIEAQGVETSVQLEKLTSEYSNAKSEMEVLAERVRAMRSQEMALRKAMFEKENLYRMTKEKISSIQQELQRIGSNPEVKRLAEQLDQILTEQKLTEARLMLATSGSLLKASVKRDFLKISVPLTIEDALISTGPALLEFQKNIQALLSSSYHSPDTTDLYNILWTKLTQTLQNQGHTILEHFIDDSAEWVFSLRSADSLTPVEIVSNLSLLLSKISVDVESQLGSFISAHKKIEFSSTAGLKIAAETDEADMGTLLQKIQELFGHLRKVLTQLTELSAIFSSIGQPVTEQHGSAALQSGQTELYALIANPKTGLIDMDQFSIMHRLINELTELLQMDHLTLVSKMSSTTRILFTMLHAHIMQGQDIDAGALDMSALRYLDTLDETIKPLRLLAVRFFDLLAQRAATFASHVDAVLMDVSPDTYFNAILQSCSGSASFSTVAYMIASLSLDTRLAYDLIGPTLGFFTINTRQIEEYCRATCGVVDRQRYCQVIRILEMVALPKLFHIVFTSAEKAMRFIRNKEICTERITAVPLDKIGKKGTGSHHEVRDTLAKERAFFLTDFISSINSTVSDYVFGKTVLCENTTSARRIAYSSSLGFRCITLDGDIVSPSGSVSGGTRSFDLSSTANVFSATDAYRRNGGAHVLLTPVKGTGAEFIDSAASSLYYDFIAMEKSTSSQAREIYSAVNKIVDAAKLSLYSLHKCGDEVSSSIASSLQSLQSRLPVSILTMLSENRITNIPIPCQLTVLLELQGDHNKYDESILRISESAGKVILLDRIMAEMKTLISDASGSDDPASLRDKLKSYAKQAAQLEAQVLHLTEQHNKKSLETDLVANEEEVRSLQTVIKENTEELKRMEDALSTVTKTLDRQTERVEAAHMRLREQSKHLEGLVDEKLNKEIEYKTLQSRLKEIDAHISAESEALTMTKEASLRMCREHESLIDKLGTTLNTVCALLMRGTNYVQCVTDLQKYDVGQISTLDGTRRATGRNHKGQRSHRGAESDGDLIFLPHELLQILDSLQNDNPTQPGVDYDELTKSITSCPFIMDGIAQRMQSQREQEGGRDHVQFLLNNPGVFEDLQAHLKSVHSKLVLSVGVSAGAQSTYEELRTNAMELQRLRDKIMKDKEKIMTFISQIDDKKMDALKASYERVNSDLSKVFAVLLPGSQASLRMMDSNDLSKGVFFDVKLGATSTTISCLSGGQRSLLALSLIFSLLLYKPCPLYILDEIDAALDLNHTHNIGILIKKSFPQSQFIVVSLKDGLFSNANVLLKTKFVGGSSAVDRYARNADSA